MTLWPLCDHGTQVLIVMDQLRNALISPWDGTLSDRGETLSVRSCRAHGDGKAFGRLNMPVRVPLSCGQGPGHRHHAFIRGHEQRHLRHDDQAAPAAFFSPASRPPGGEGLGGDCKEQHP
ncbi:hypothetical protein LJR118_003264 [Acidovorax sp. LjRoot118]|uniref:hypothetical protein n=1 Tax=Acidovorax sp. LjRoot118 TaxID=3342256 RepID=UPI003ECE4AE4